MAKDLMALVMELLETLKSDVVAFGEKLDISFPQCHALWCLRPDEPAPMRELADTMHCDPSNVTGIIDRLEANGLVERQVSPSDRRVKTLVLTDKGARVHTQLVERLTTEFPLVKNLTKTQQTQLRDLIAAGLRSGG